ncbi:MAG: ABC transporter ATP-binding protein, partial [Nocardioidaceae bacterium]
SMHCRPDAKQRSRTTGTWPISPDHHSGGADVEVEGLTWRPLRRRTAVLRDLSLRIPAGQRVLLAGPSGAGKSTLLRAIAGLLLTAGHGDLAGQVRIDGRPGGRPGEVGMLAQDPLAGVVAETVGRDVAFGLENREVPREEIWPQVHAALEAVQFPYPADRSTRALSGGETQRLALAGCLVLGSRVLLLDEPTSMLDPPAATSVRSAVRRQIAERRSTAVIVEHHLEPWLDFADRLVVLGDVGEIVADGDPAEVLREQSETLARRGVWVPGLPAPEPLTVPPDLVAPWAVGPSPIVVARDVDVRLRRSLVDSRAEPVAALTDASAEVLSGRTLALTGRSGAGKSTLVSVLSGLLRPSAGTVQAHPALATRRGREPWRWASRDLAARLSWVAQTPEQAVVARTVEDEVLAAAHACRRDPHRSQERARGLLEVLGLAARAAASPYHLSGGEQRRLMLAAALAHGPHAALLDEPTVGQDRETWAAVVGIVRAAQRSGAGVVLSSHDTLAVSAAADRVLTLDAGRVAG